MLWNKDLLFLHVPKTGGMAISEVLTRTLATPIYLSVPEGHAEQRPGVVVLAGKRHERLAEAASVLEEHGRSLEEFRVILAGMRNPYELEVSRYAYLLLGHRWDKGMAQEIATQSGFEAFACESPFHGRRSPALEEYYLLDGKMPDNLHILGHEKLQDDLQAALSKLGLDLKIRLRQINATDHADWRTYMTTAAEQAIYSRFSWFFDNKYYERITTSPT